MMIAEGFTCQRYGFNVGADKFSLLTIENGKTSIMRLSEWTLISQSQKSHSDRLLETFHFCIIQAAAPPIHTDLNIIETEFCRKLQRSRIDSLDSLDSN